MARVKLRRAASHGLRRVVLTPVGEQLGDHLGDQCVVPASEEERAADSSIPRDLPPGQVRGQIRWHEVTQRSCLARIAYTRSEVFWPRSSPRRQMRSATSAAACSRSISPAAGASAIRSATTGSRCSAT
jgi:hypothetical protein